MKFPPLRLSNEFITIFCNSDNDIVVVNVEPFDIDQGAFGFGGEFAAVEKEDWNPGSEKKAVNLRTGNEV